MNEYVAGLAWIGVLVLFLLLYALHFAGVF